MQLDGSMTALEVAKHISEGLARAALVAKADGKFVSMNEVIDGDCTFEVFTFKDEEGRLAYRHTCSHILAQAVRNIYPTVQLAIGPAGEGTVFTTTSSSRRRSRRRTSTRSKPR